MLQAMENLRAYTGGLLLGLSIIMAIGPQNAFVLRAGLLRNHHRLAACGCIGADFALIGLATAGLASLAIHNSLLHLLVSILGITILAISAVKSFLRAATVRQSLISQKMAHTPALPVFMTALAVSLLNPLVYIDTVLILGSAGLGFGEELRWSFALGACTASMLWFFLLAEAASYFSVFFAQPRFWRYVEIVTGTIMSASAVGIFSATLSTTYF